MLSCACANGASLVAHTARNLLATQEMWVQSLGQEGPLENGVAILSSILAWRVPWTEEPRGLQSTGSQRVGQVWETDTTLHTCICITVAFHLFSTFKIKTPWTRKESLFRMDMDWHSKWRNHYFFLQPSSCLKANSGNTHVTFLGQIFGIIIFQEKIVYLILLKKMYHLQFSFKFSGVFISYFFSVVCCFFFSPIHTFMSYSCFISERLSRYAFPSVVVV